MKKIFLKDGSFAHCEYSNNPVPPKSFAENIEWDRSPGPPEETVYTDHFITMCEGGIGWLLEPRELIPGMYDYVANNHHKFKTVWTHDKALLSQIPNGVMVPLGGCWIDEIDRAVHNKNKQFSIIASSKRQLSGHKLRHDIIKAAGNNIDVFGNGYVPIKDKIEGLKDYRYHFAIENSATDYWFTEKLIDCLMTGTIPIYWGPPSIHNFFDTSGFIIFNDLIDLKEKLKMCTPEYYESRINVISNNFNTAKQYILAENYIWEHELYSA